MVLNESVTGISATVANVAGGALNIGVILVVIVFVAIVIFGLIILLMQSKKYSKFRIVIWGVNGFGQLVQEFDDGGIFVDKKTGNKRLFLKANKVGLDPDNIPYISSKGKDFVFLFRTGLKNFRYIKPKIQDNDFGFSVGEEDVNWALNTYERQKAMIGKKTWLDYLPFIILAVVSIVILILFIFLFKKFDVLADIATHLDSAAQALSNKTVIL